MALLRNLKIDPKSLGKHLWLVDATPVVEYTKSGERTDKIVGYRYVVTLPAHGFESATAPSGNAHLDGKHRPAGCITGYHPCPAGEVPP